MATIEQLLPPSRTPNPRREGYGCPPTWRTDDQPVRNREAPVANGAQRDRHEFDRATSSIARAAIVERLVGFSASSRRSQNTGLVLKK